MQRPLTAIPTEDNSAFCWMESRHDRLDRLRHRKRLLRKSSADLQRHHHRHERDDRTLGECHAQRAIAQQETMMMHLRPGYFLLLAASLLAPASLRAQQQTLSTWDQETDVAVTYTEQHSNLVSTPAFWLP